jgi:hypothetical protein
MTVTAPEYVLARAVLLDALHALGMQRDAVILVGAQAIYLHTGDAELATAPMTTDADLTIDVERVAAVPELATAMRAGGFEPGDQPGSWKGRFGVLVDLMTVPHQSGRSSPSARGARIPSHAPNVARITAGLEAALIDHEEHEIVALDQGDPRTFMLQVAGPAALLVAKLIKLAERCAEEDAGRKSRIDMKDALDVFRLLRGVDLETLASGFGSHARDRYARPVAERALAFLREAAQHEEARLARLVGAASGGDRTIPASLVVLVQQLLGAV